jgi:hypothetical protein
LFCCNAALWKRWWHGRFLLYNATHGVKRRRTTITCHCFFLLQHNSLCE